MSAIDQSSIALTHETDQPSPPRRARRLRIARWVAVVVWATVVVWRTVTDGFAFNRELLLVYICTGLIAASIGQGRRVFQVVRDWLPFALVLIAYDLSRGAATLIGRPTLWHWQADADRWMFFGNNADGLAAGASEAVDAAVVGGRDQQRLHVVLHPPVRDRGGAVATGPGGVEGLRPVVRRAVISRRW